MDDPNVMLDIGLEWQDFAAFADYFLLTFGIALWFRRRQKTSMTSSSVDDGCRGFAVGLSSLATLFSTLSFLGMSGR